MLKMFWGVDKHYPPYLKNHYFLISANALWQRPKEYNRHRFILRRYDRRFMMLDSGGYSFFSQFNSYPFTRDEYLKLVNHYRPLAWIPMDLPCEPEILKNTNNTERIKKTIDNLRYFVNNPHSPHGMLAVVQGHTLTERLNCFESILNTGIETQWLAIGSLCSLKNPKQINHTVNSISNHAKKIGWNGYFHLFGVTVNYLKKYNTPPNVVSFDTSAWSYHTPYNKRKKRFLSYKASLSPHITLGYHESPPPGLRSPKNPTHPT